MPSSYVTAGVGQPCRYVARTMNHDEEKTLCRQAFVESQRRTMQGSYERRAPAKESLPLILDARNKIITYLFRFPDDVEILRMLSILEESLLHYTVALRHLDKVLELSPSREKGDLKRRANLVDALGIWRDLMLTPDQLQDLGVFLERWISNSGCEHGLDGTQEWLAFRKIKKAKDVLKSLRNNGGGCDCEVLANVVQT